MAVIAVVNRKGGSGKSTLATHLAAYFANHGGAVMLGDVDRQQSTQSWLRSRALQQLPRSAPIVGWAVDPKRVLRPPAGVQHVVLDTPGGLRGFDLARVVAFADVIVMPVCNSMFDRESAADGFAELLTMPRIASGRCKIAAVGMRLDARTKSAQVLEAWAASQKLPFIGVLREAQVYVRCVEQGLTVFDLAPAQVEADLAQWKPIVAWLEPLLQRVHRAELRANAAVVRAPVLSTRAELMPSKPSFAPSAPGAFKAELAPARTPAAGARAEATMPPRSGDAAVDTRRRAPKLGLAALFGWLVAPRFGHRNS